MMLRPDILAELPHSRRAAKEQSDAEFLQKESNVHECIVSRSALERDAELAGVPSFRAVGSQFRELVPGEDVDMIVCVRVDLDHPIYFADNLFCDCADCGCGLQHRPNVPTGPRLCVCCAARRTRENPDYRP